MKETPVAPTHRGDLRPLVAEGVSPWLDGFHRGLFGPDRPARLTEPAGLRGATSNPALLAARLADEPSYAQQLARLAEHGVSVEGAVWAISVQDLRMAADELLPVFRATQGYDGLVSADMDPRMAHNPAAATAEAIELVRAVDRPNLLVKIPATPEGLTALRDCVALGIGVHATGVFSVQRYREVVDAWFGGLERALRAGRTVSRIASVASLPVGPVDREIDRRLTAIGTGPALELRGTGAVATARLLYQVYEEQLGSARWRALRAHGARPQRLLWSTAELADTAAARSWYVEGLVSWGTVHAMTRPLLDEAARALRLRGDTLMGQHEAALTVHDRLGRLGIPYRAVVRRLESENITGLVDSWMRLHAAMEARLGGKAGAPRDGR
ncbi:transaldolase family protein [Kitasatospora sp. NPDC004615]|uniref:transaldolase family protein n=1 Tax=Kitasatospora sp. NPDC004615 TaxID=3364017 RepID=UPI0036CEFAA7